MSDSAPQYVDSLIFGRIRKRTALLIKGTIALFVLFILGIITWNSVLTYVDVHEFGYTFNAITGEAKPIDRNGYIATPPLLINVYTIDTRPVQVCITADVSGSVTTDRTLNCKLVRFNPDGFETWIQYQGSGSYTGYKLQGTLKAYAYEDAGRDYRFLDEIIEMGAQEQ